ncbi:hypothetical protein [Brevundimonas sp. NIBR11]|uniref:hypothetical protein n=1 Tax=Brevundimonas sp. NIBR11 TaxID=3015999 RepID=UPI0022F0FE2B|nr:hypothetical protein [Brevundimonas sp. NIBR11]WGM31440.1 hypothetical protein KKHFBJBL_01686 [Brevundimonas sp. NIBR11]
MRFGVFAAAAVLGAAIALPAFAQTQPAPQDGDAVDDIEVLGDRAAPTLNERVDAFVNAVAAPIGDYGPARWHRRVCIGSVNFQPAAAQLIVDRVSQVALDLGVQPGEPGCAAQVMIVATNDGAATAAAMVDRNGRWFRAGGEGMDRGEAALMRFRTGDRAVRWWQVSLPVDADTGQRAVRLPGDDPSSSIAINKFVASRLASALRDNLTRIMIIVDVDQLGDVTFAQLADYVALVSLAQIDDQANPAGSDTVLNLFNDPAGVSGLTSWDMAYLGALYNARLDTVSSNARMGDVERGMANAERRRQAGDE